MLFISGEMERSGASDKNPENRFANKLLDKLIMYLDSSSSGMKLVKPSSNFTRRNDFKKSSRGVKFFFKVRCFFFVLLASALSNGVDDKGYEVVPKALWSSLQGTS